MRRHIALLLAALSVAGTLTVPALAAEPPAGASSAQEALEEAPGAGKDAPGQEASEEAGEAGGETGEEGEETPAQPEPDPEGTVSWANLDSRIRAGSLSARILIENITGIEDIDYDQMYEDLRRQLNEIAKMQWMLILLGAGEAADALDQSYDALRDTFDAIKDGELQADNADVIWQLEDTVNQVVSGGETLYLSLLELERQAADGQRGLDALDRSLEELRLREQLGQVSRQTVAELEQTRSETVSQLNTLAAGIRDTKIQLQNLIGVEPTGEIALGPLPTREEMEWEEPDYEADLEAAKAASWTLRSAQLTLDEAEDQWEENRSLYRGASKQYMYQQAEHTWNAAQLTYQSTVQTFETGFLNLYHALDTCGQALESAQASLAWQESLLATAQTRYELGLISQSEVLSAQDDVASAQSAVDGAWNDLFAARIQYRRAVETGLVSAQA